MTGSASATAKQSAARDTATKDRAPLSAPQKALIKLGLVRDIDLALHLPLRYEDETRITPMDAVPDGEIGRAHV